MAEFKKFNLNDYRDCLIVTDEKISELYGINGENVFLLPQGEAAKSFFYVEKLCDWFLSRNLDRSGTVVAIGGGSVGDTVGFAASVYKRGVKLVNIPTTLVAQIDSSIGGKTAVNVGDVKNAAGTYILSDTFIDVSFLSTLDDVQILNGKGELLKYRMLSIRIDEISNADLITVVKACVDYKCKICELDPFDNGFRRRLNFGHTVGHAMELSLDIPHGLAVANGIYYETSLACNLGLCSESYAEKWKEIAKREFTVYPISRDILGLITADKKNAHGKVGFALPSKFDTVYLDFNEAVELILND